MADVFISLTAFGNAEVRRHGQLWFARLACEAGADGVEVRGELLHDPEVELVEIAEALDGRAALVYSSAEGLWDVDGALDDAALGRALAATRRLDAPRLKMSIGGFGAHSAASLATLGEHLADAGTGIELVIENDQTVTAGTRVALRRFFAAADAAGLPLGMTFDVGNWHYTGECPLAAAGDFAARVRYVHAKGVQRLPRKWVAVPLAESAAPWRSVLAAMPADVPWAIEYPLAGEDLLDVTRTQVALVRAVAAAQA